MTFRAVSSLLMACNFKYKISSCEAGNTTGHTVYNYAVKHMHSGKQFLPLQAQVYYLLYLSQDNESAEISIKPTYQKPAVFLS